jgi:hypothetical protein
MKSKPSSLRTFILFGQIVEYFLRSITPSMDWLGDYARDLDQDEEHRDRYDK